MELSAILQYTTTVVDVAEGFGGSYDLDEGEGRAHTSARG